MFKFNLQWILEMRDEAVNQAQTKVEQARSICKQLNDLLVQEKEAYFFERDSLNGQLAASDFNRLALYDSSLETRKKRMMELLEALRSAQTDLELAEQDLVQAKRELKILENLREKKQAAHNAKEQSKEQKFLDEQATLRHFRKDRTETKRGN